MNYDLEERTAKFGEAIIDFAKSIPRSAITNPLISQIVRSATSVGANYMEACAAESKKDFRHKISICKKRDKRNQTLVTHDRQSKFSQQRTMQKSLEGG